MKSVIGPETLSETPDGDTHGVVMDAAS